MKKNYLISSMTALLLSWGGFAQVTNGDFEVVKENFLPSNWGMDFVQMISINPTTGETEMDQIQYPWCIPSFVFSTTESQAGQYAMELSNGFNVTRNEAIMAQASIFNNPELDSPGWNAGVPIEPGANVTLLGLYYKFLPAGNETGEAKITVLNNQGEEIGSTTIDLVPTGNNFEYLYSFIPFNTGSTPSYMYITLKTAKEGQTPVFGTRLVVDNVVTNFAALDNVVIDPIASPKFAVISEVVNGQLEIRPGDLVGLVTYNLFDTTGKRVRTNTMESSGPYLYTLDISDLESGTYILTAQDAHQMITQKIIKK
ncbi:T9SS type A sorting domain-containing protein [Flavobacterium stagni]|uniref:T9SS type A sorting domain-containing protein n=1 Tax=Flavobacterium stagni TaxID=2506421 RepID=A0A4Q1K9S7_9FLAO|nr:T9SS type A sorting domain-containing protein [Flavobacterium stagni]RXR22608.1 T9SS type A sorting domain-containing protein [Flavobacterium stagni]